MAKGNEIERKWLTAPGLNIETLEVLEEARIEQRYLAIDTEREREVRLRRVGDGTIQVLTNKVGAGFVRGEANKKLPIAADPDELEDMWNMAEELAVLKTRLWLPHTVSGRRDDQVVDGIKEVVFDIYDGRHNGLRVVEAELLHPDVAFVPKYAGLDVTYDNRFKNAQLAIHGGTQISTYYI